MPPQAQPIPTPSTTPLPGGAGAVRAPSNPGEAAAAKLAATEKIDLDLEIGASPKNVASPASTSSQAQATAAPGPAVPAPTSAQGQTGAAAPPAAGAPAAAPAEPTQEQLQSDPKFGPKFRALAKEKHDLTLRERAIKDQEKKFAAFEKLDALMKDDPAEAFRVLGANQTEVIKKLAQAAGKVKPKDDVTALKEWKAQVEKDNAEKARTAAERDHQAKVDGFKKGIGEVIEGKKDDLKALNKLIAMGETPEVQAASRQTLLDTVFNVIDLQYKTDGSILTVEEAASRVEQHYGGLYRHLHEAFQAAPAPAAAPAAPQAGVKKEASQTASKATASGQAPGTTTLSSAQTATASAAQPASKKPTDREETRDETIERLSKTLFVRKS